MNRFGMNKSIRFITSFVRDGYSTEFLYTATAQDELLSHGMTVISEQSRSIRFEKFGRPFGCPGHLPDGGVHGIHAVPGK